MKKLRNIIAILGVFLFALVLTGCGCSKRVKQEKIVSNVKVSIVNENGNNFEGVLNFNENDEFISIDSKNNFIGIDIDEKAFKDLNIFDASKKIVSMAVDKDAINDSTEVNVSVVAPEAREEELYRYIYKYAIEPLIENNIDASFNYKFNE